MSSARPEDEVSDTELTAAMGSSAYRKAARTFKAIARSDRRGGHGSRFNHVIDSIAYHISWSKSQRPWQV